MACSDGDEPPPDKPKPPPAQTDPKSPKPRDKPPAARIDFQSGDLLKRQCDSTVTPHRKTQFVQHGEEIWVWTLDEKNGIVRARLANKPFSGKLKLRLDECNALIVSKMREEAWLSLISYTSKNASEGSGRRIENLPGITAGKAGDIDVRSGGFGSFQVARIGKDDGILHYTTYTERQDGISIKQETAISVSLGGIQHLSVSKWQFSPHVLLSSEYIALVRKKAQRFVVRFYRIGDKALELMEGEYEVGDPMGGTGRHAWIGEVYVAIGPKMSDRSKGREKYSLFNQIFNFSSSSLHRVERSLGEGWQLFSTMNPPLGVAGISPNAVGWLDARLKDENREIRMSTLYKHRMHHYRLKKNIVVRMGDRRSIRFAWRDKGYGALPVVLFLDKEGQLSIVDLQTPAQLVTVLEGKKLGGFSVYPYETATGSEDILIATEEPDGTPGSLVYWHGGGRLEDKPWYVVEKK
ncbi:MAG: hypothetical protein GY862_03385 [Gammaproteobacteria bacterium]|nr:hypothetical protein [Gammaproteobacteria bacterium]